MFAPDHTLGGRVLVTPLDAVRWQLTEPLRYIGKVDEFVVPAGYVTDFATIPRVAVWLIARFGLYTKAAILHDWLLTEHVAKGSTVVSAVDADALFLRALRELEVPPYRRALMWTGVRWGAAFSRYRKAGWWETFPRVFLMTLAFLCSIVPPLAMIVVAVALLCHGAIESVVSLFSPKDEMTSGSLST
jgi:hypothetical protein